MNDALPVGLLEKQTSKDSRGIKDKSQGMSVALHIWGFLSVRDPLQLSKGLQNIQVSMGDLEKRQMPQ